jgi:hypothetical protein
MPEPMRQGLATKSRRGWRLSHCCSALVLTVDWHPKLSVRTATRVRELDRQSIEAHRMLSSQAG